MGGRRHQDFRQTFQRLAVVPLQQYLQHGGRYVGDTFGKGLKNLLLNVVKCHDQHTVGVRLFEAPQNFIRGASQSQRIRMLRGRHTA